MNEANMHSDSLIPLIHISTHLGLTIFYTTLYALLFLLVYTQLILILCYKHKRLSYQSLFLFLSLIWSALRVTLFTFYFKNTVTVNHLSGVEFWLLYCCPGVIQFITLILLILYFSQVALETSNKYEYAYLSKVFRGILLLSVIVFITTNIICGAYIRHQKQNQNVHAYEIIAVRVYISELLFLFCGISLAICIYKLSVATTAKPLLETKGTTFLQTTITCGLIVLLYISRAIYNITIVTLTQFTGAPSFNFGWINVTDQSEVIGFSYVAFGIVLFVWEVLPTFIVVIFFRVRKPVNDLSVNLSQSSLNSPAFFFDNPRRYDSDEEHANSRRVIFSDSQGKRCSCGHCETFENRYCQIFRANRYSSSSPYGSFHSSSMSRHGSLGHSSGECSLKFSRSPPPSKVFHSPTSPIIKVIGVHSKRQVFA